MKKTGRMRHLDIVSNITIQQKISLAVQSMRESLSEHLSSLLELLRRSCFNNLIASCGCSTCNSLYEALDKASK